jgi:hypothetical protein
MNTDQRLIMPIPDEVEILSHYVGNPKCPACHGSKRLGIAHIPGIKDTPAHYELLICYCAKRVDGEYARIQKTIGDFVEQLRLTNDVNKLLISAFQGLKDSLDEQNKIQKENVSLLDTVLTQIDRHTVGYWVSAFIKLFMMKEEHAIRSAEEVSAPAEQG